MKDITVLLHNVRSAHNVGSIFRTADAAGVAHLYLSGYTPLPIDRFGRVNKEIAKTALGAERYIPWSSGSFSYLIAEARREGRRILGVEQDKRSKDYRCFPYPQKTLLIFGNEVRGLSPALRRRCDALIEIPMLGKKESLNVAVAAGVVLFRARG